MCIKTNSRNKVLYSISENGIRLSEEEMNNLFKTLYNYTEYNLRVTKDISKTKEEAININDIYIDEQDILVTDYKRRTNILMRYNNSFNKGFINSYVKESTQSADLFINKSDYPAREKQVFLIEDTSIINGRKERKLEVLVYINPDM